MLRTILIVVVLAPFLLAAEVPQAEISNGIIQAKLYLPDGKHGYYQGTRFDWSGVIFSLRYQEHEYFGPWFERYDPKTHDAITGPVEEYLTNNMGLGYEEAPIGGPFIRIGVGSVRKPEEKAYRRFNTYEIVDPGEWRIRKGGSWIEFTHELKETSGYAYVYTKKIRLEKNKPVLTLEHTLKNTGRRVIETQQYNHNFFTLDQQPTGPDFVVRFPFEARSKQELKGIAKVGGGLLEYLQEMEKGQSLYTELEGFGTGAKDYDFRIENRRTGAGVRITGDQPLVKLAYWSIRTTLCPEPYIQIKVTPGQTTKWIITYQFYTLPAASKP